jgi:hypothetical protein
MIRVLGSLGGTYTATGAGFPPYRQGSTSQLAPQR